MRFKGGNNNITEHGWLLLQLKYYLEYRHMVKNKPKTLKKENTMYQTGTLIQMMRHLGLGSA